MKSGRCVRGWPMWVAPRPRLSLTERMAAAWPAAGSLEKLVQHQVEGELVHVRLGNAILLQEALLECSAELPEAVPHDGQVLVAIGEADAPGVDAAGDGAVVDEQVVERIVAMGDDRIRG